MPYDTFDPPTWLTGLSLLSIGFVSLLMWLADLNQDERN